MTFLAVSKRQQDCEAGAKQVAEHGVEMLCLEKRHFEPEVRGLAIAKFLTDNMHVRAQARFPRSAYICFCAPSFWPAQKSSNGMTAYIIAV